MKYSKDGEAVDAMHYTHEESITNAMNFASNSLSIIVWSVVDGLSVQDSDSEPQRIKIGDWLVVDSDKRCYPVDNKVFKNTYKKVI